MKRKEFFAVMLQAFQLGQKYWQYADSENPNVWHKADGVKADFEELVKSTAALYIKEEKDDV